MDILTKEDGKYYAYEVKGSSEVKDRILPLLPKVREYIKQMNSMLGQTTIPNIKISPHCSDSYGCSFARHCWKDVPDNSIFLYKGIKGKTKWELFNSEIVTVEDIPDNYKLNNTEQLVVSSVKNNLSYINNEVINSFISRLNYPG